MLLKKFFWKKSDNHFFQKTEFFWLWILTLPWTVFCQWFWITFLPKWCFKKHKMLFEKCYLKKCYLKNVIWKPIFSFESSSLFFSLLSLCNFNNLYSNTNSFIGEDQTSKNKSNEELKTNLFINKYLNKINFFKFFF